MTNLVDSNKQVARATQILVAALAVAPMPGSVSAQAPTSARDTIVWHWFRACARSDSLILQVRLDGQSVYSAAFPICQLRRSQLKPEPQQRLLTFRVDAVPRRFGRRSRATEPQPIEGTVWEAGGERDAMLLGVSLATGDQVLLNAVHVARSDATSRTEPVRGLVITTRPVRLSK